METIDVKRDYCPKAIVHNFINLLRTGQREEGKEEEAGSEERGGGGGGEEGTNITHAYETRT